uniref:Uncharacterized protein n=1 Tax=Clytia hemisphaerica TaxID=252671 RepID=A0A7M5XC56_9CNID
LESTLFILIIIFWKIFIFYQFLLLLLDRFIVIFDHRDNRMMDMSVSTTPLNPAKDEVEGQLTSIPIKGDDSNTKVAIQCQSNKTLSQENNPALKDEPTKKETNKTPTAQEVYDMVHSADNRHILSGDGKKRRLRKRSSNKSIITVEGSSERKLSTSDEGNQAAGTGDKKPTVNIKSKIVFFEEKKKTQISNASPSENEMEKEVPLPTSVANTIRKDLDEVPLSNKDLATDATVQAQSSYAEIAKKPKPPVVKPRPVPTKTAAGPKNDTVKKTSNDKTSKIPNKGKKPSNWRRKSSHELNGSTTNGSKTSISDNSSQGLNKKVAYFDHRCAAGKNNSKEAIMKSKASLQKTDRKGSQIYLCKKSSPKSNHRTNTANKTKNYDPRKNPVKMQRRKPGAIAKKFEEITLHNVAQGESSSPQQDQAVANQSKDDPIVASQSLVKTKTPSYADVAKKPAVRKPSPVKQVPAERKDKGKDTDSTTKNRKKGSSKKIIMVQPLSHTQMLKPRASQNKNEETSTTSESVAAKAAFFASKMQKNDMASRKVIPKQGSIGNRTPLQVTAQKSNFTNKRGQRKKESSKSCALVKKSKLSQDSFTLDRAESKEVSLTVSSGSDDELTDTVSVSSIEETVISVEVVDSLTPFEDFESSPKSDQVMGVEHVHFESSRKNDQETVVQDVHFESSPKNDQATEVQDVHLESSPKNDQETNVQDVHLESSAKNDPETNVR